MVFSNIPIDESYNIPKSIINKMGAGLHNKENHPLHILKKEIGILFGEEYKIVDDLSPIVSVTDNFDKLLIPKDHPSRSRSDTYYINSSTVLRTHTSAHQNNLLSQGLNKFLVIGDVYRRDEIDSHHYPVFHQCEGVCLYDEDISDEIIINELKNTLERVVIKLFGNDIEIKWNDSYFPFTEPSYEMEVMYRGKWLELLGCGLIKRDILDQSGNRKRKGWAFGLGLERIAMVLFDIPDIRLMWSNDPRFVKQFTSLDCKFKQYSNQPPCYKDISMWVSTEIPSSDNDLYEIIREECEDLVESVNLIDTFVNQKTGKTSKCYRILYRSMDRTLTNSEVNIIHTKLLSKINSKLDVVIR